MGSKPDAGACFTIGKVPPVPSRAPRVRKPTVGTTVPCCLRGMLRESWCTETISRSAGVSSAVGKTCPGWSEGESTRRLRAAWAFLLVGGSPASSWIDRSVGPEWRGSPSARLLKLSAARVGESSKRIPPLTETRWPPGLVRQACSSGKASKQSVSSAEVTYWSGGPFVRDTPRKPRESVLLRVGSHLPGHREAEPNPALVRFQLTGASSPGDPSDRQSNEERSRGRPHADEQHLYSAPDKGLKRRERPEQTREEQHATGQ